MGRRWKLRPCPPNAEERLADLRVSALVARLLANRGIADKTAVELDINRPLDIIRFYFLYSRQTTDCILDSFLAPCAMHAFDRQMCGFIHRRILLAEPQTVLQEIGSQKSSLASRSLESATLATN